MSSQAKKSSQKIKPSQRIKPSQKVKPKKYQAKPKSSQDQAKPISSQAKASQASKIFGMTKPSQAKAYKIGWLWPGLSRSVFGAIRGSMAFNRNLRPFIMYE